MLSGRVGGSCTVYFRHDALGMAAGIRAPPTTDNVNGADTHLSGKLLRANAGWVTIGVCTGEASPEEAARLLHMGVDRYFVKPVSPDELLASVEAALY